MRKIMTGILALIIAMGALAFGYNAGMTHVLHDAEISASGSTVTITIDGNMYEHVAE